MLVNYQPLLSNIFPLVPPRLFFFLKYRRNTFLRMSFIEQQNFMIYLQVNKRTAMLSLATSHIAHLCNQLNHVALPISMPRFKSIIFIKIAPKFSYFCKKLRNFLALGASPRTPTGLWRLRHSPPIVNFWLRACITVFLVRIYGLTKMRMKQRILFQGKAKT